MRFIPSDPLITYSDCCAVEVTAAYARFTRPRLDHMGFEFVNPGARVRFVCDGTRIDYVLRHVARITRDEAFNPVGLVLVDGKVSEYFAYPGERTQSQHMVVTIHHKTPAPRLHELIMPHGAAFEFMGVEVEGGALTMPAPPRPATRFVAYGDSIAQGFKATLVSKSWAAMLAQAKHWQLINLGYAGRPLRAADGGIVGGLNPDIATVLVGVNDYMFQRPLTDCQREMSGLLRQLKAASPNAQVHVITPLWSALDHAIPLEAYRETLTEAVAEVADRTIRIHDGLTLVPGSKACFADDVHPNDLGHAYLFKNLAELFG